MIYDINGNQIETGGSVSSADIKTALVGAVADGTVSLGESVGATLAYTSPGTSWETNANTAYQNLLTAYKAVPQSGIPFFISTDSHGRGVEAHRWMNNADVDGMSVLNINLGDTVGDKFGTAALDNILARTKQVKDYISAVGNHDKSTGTEVASHYYLNKTFITTMGRVVNVGPMNCYSIVDGEHNVKIMVVDTNTLDENGALGQGFPTTVASWIIQELSDTKNMDILWINHWPLWDSCRQREDAEETSDAMNTITGGTSVQFAMWQVLIDRKNKASGTYTDTDGVAHSYDFTDCKSDFLCCLHGHIHAEWLTTEKGLTAYAADWYGNNKSCTFGLIDRLNSKVTFWVFDSTGCLEPLELPI